MKNKINYKEKFLERGLTPLEEIKSGTQKVDCQDAEGYKYHLDYHGAVGDKRTKQFDRWDKTNPFKAYNMRLFASLNQENVKILSTDEELMNASHQKVKFICPKCGVIYEKKWCHWLLQEKNEHWCSKCAKQNAHEKCKLSYEELCQRFAEKGFTLCESPDSIDSGERFLCMDEDGYKYAISLNSLSGGNKGTNKFSVTNPYATENLQKWCDENNISLTVVDHVRGKKNCFKFKCECGEEFETQAYIVMSLTRTRCHKCVNKDSRYEIMVTEWLQENNISFEREFRIDDCRYKRALPFDFKCDTSNGIILIEVDGAHHFEAIQWTDEEKFKYQKARDKIKDDYCQSHNIPLLRLPYWLFRADGYKKKLNQTFFGTK